PHHAGRSGYHQLAEHLKAAAGARAVEVDRVPRLPASVRRTLIGATRLEWYEEWALALELAAARQMSHRQATVCHFLYGEDSFSHLGRLAPLLRLRRNRLVASFHQPPRVFDEVYRSSRRLRQLD